MHTTPSTRSPILEVFSAFLLLGLTSFGGPIAHLGYFRTEFVERRRWLSEQAYADLVALCQFLPGPSSSQVGFALGLMHGLKITAVAIVAHAIWGMARTLCPDPARAAIALSAIFIVKCMAPACLGCGCTTRFGWHADFFIAPQLCWGAHQALQLPCFSAAHKIHYY